MLRVPFISLALVLSVASCGNRQPVDKEAKNISGLPDLKVPAPTVTGEPHNQTQPAKPLPGSASVIPVVLHGRWGLSPADCISTKGNAKGLLVVTSDGLDFHESRAVPAADAETDGNSIGGDFAFAGEGRSWTRYESLKLDKHVLIRTETNPTASFSYAKCS
jgi:hypothetical protein